MKSSGYRLRNLGESIIEVLASIMIMTIVLTAAFQILQFATTTDVSVRQRIIATNLAKEGIEAVRNIRDTNWLKYSSDRETKWICHDTAKTAESKNACTGNPTPLPLLIDRAVYALEFDTNRFYLKKLTEEETEDNGNFRLYSHEGNPWATIDISDTSISAKPTGFYRKIEIGVKNPFYNTPDEGPSESDENCGKIECPDFKVTDDNLLQVTSRVFWYDDSNKREVAMEAWLYNFYNRTSYE